MDGRKKLMILGGSNCQIHAVQRARKRGISTVLIDYTEHPPAAEIADLHLPVSTFDAKECIRAAREQGIDGVMTLGTDQPVLTATRVAAALGLPCDLTEAQAFAVTNKRPMKQILKSAEIPTAPFLFLTREGKFLDTDGDETDCFLQPPYVMKPLDSQGQRGVFKLDSLPEVLAHLPETLSYSREETCLVESFYPSDEITVSGWLRDGKLVPLSVTDRCLYPDAMHIGVCTGHRFPSIHIGRYGEIRALSEQVAWAFDLAEGPFYLQLLLGEEGLVVNEVACRIGGAFEDVAIPYLTGFSILDAVIDTALGEKPAAPDPALRCDKIDARCFVLLLFCEAGRIRSITPEEELRALPYLLDCGFNYAEGEEIPAMENAAARFGHAVLAGDAGSMAERVRDFLSRLRVLDGSGRDLLQRDRIDEKYL